MRIGIDAFPIMRSQGGVAGYVHNLLRALVCLECDDEFVAYLPKETRRDKKVEDWEFSPQVKKVEVRRPFFRWRGWLDGLDLYHGTNYKVQTVGRLGAVVTIHDLWLDRHPEYSKKVLGQRLSFFRTRQRASQAIRVITVSEHSAKDIQELYGLSKDRITVIPHGVSSEYRLDREGSRMSELRAIHAIPSGPYILFVGGADPRKNHATLFQAYAGKASIRQSHTLVVVGDSFHRLGNIMETARTLRIGDRVACTGTVPADDLRCFYSHADLFVFPSRYEGFGLPVLEAMACGAPVITSNTTALPEVAGDAAILINPEDPEELAEAMIRVISDTRLRETLQGRGIERAREFTWGRTARQTLAVYREVCQ
jgi:glycosyltransferase involved in cell wall biosynthesis